MTGKIRLAIIMLLFFATTSSFAEETKALATWAPILKNTMPAIVNVAVQGYLGEEDDNEDENPRSRLPNQSKPKKFQSIGSGVIVDPKNGIVITNDHVIRNASLITVTLNDGRRLKAKLIG